MQIKNMIRYHLTFVRMAIISKTKDVRLQGILAHCWMKYKLAQPIFELSGGPSKN
jgi:hypothetical protein